MRRTLFVFFFLCFIAHGISEEIAGIWLRIDKKTQQPQSVIAIYPYEGKYYGKILGTYNNFIELEDTIYHPIKRATGIAGNPYYSGLDFIWDATPRSDGKYKGQVIDPRNGHVYDAVLWRKAENLILRGELLIFGRNETWMPFPEDFFNESFPRPDLSTFAPNLPHLP